MSDKLYYDDEINLQEIVLTLLKGWKTIFLMTIVFGASAFGYSKLQTPVYEASATILIDQNGLALDSSPMTELKSNEIRQLVADELGVALTSLPEPTISNDKVDKALFTITIRSENAQQAADLANTWAVVGISLVNAKLQDRSTRMDAAMGEIAAADQALSNYLEEHALSAWTWADLSALTGVASANDMVIQGNLQELPEISSKERLEIAQLMRERVAAEKVYSILLEETIRLEYTLDANPPRVLGHAVVSHEAIKPKTLMNTTIGFVAGSILGIFWVFAFAWWQGDKVGKEK